MSNCQDVISLYFTLRMRKQLRTYYKSQGEETGRYEAFMATKGLSLALSVNLNTTTQTITLASFLPFLEPKSSMACP
jgi:hypothetical protein